MYCAVHIIYTDNGSSSALQDKGYYNNPLFNCTDVVVSPMILNNIKCESFLHTWNADCIKIDLRSFNAIYDPIQIIGKRVSDRYMISKQTES